MFKGVHEYLVFLDQKTKQPRVAKALAVAQKIKKELSYPPTGLPTPALPSLSYGEAWQFFWANALFDLL